MPIVPLYTGDIPNPSQSQPEFDENTQDALDYFLTVADPINQAITALNFNSTSSNSTTSVLIGTGTKNFTVDTGKSYLPGMTVKIARTSAPTNWMVGEVVSYNSGTGALVVSVSKVQGSGTFTDWTITLAATEQLDDQFVNDQTAVTFDHGNDYVLAEDGSDSGKNKKALISSSKIQDIDAAVASNALTVTINPTTLDFRSTTLTDGTPVTRTLAAAASLVIPNTATLGTVNAVAARLAVLAIDNAGTIETAIVNLAGGNNLDETTLISTTTISTGADSANVIYSTTGRSNVAFRVVGFIDITEASAGVWATGPTLVQGAGGNALTAMSSIGYGQTWQDVTASRSVATTYYNTTGKPIVVYPQSGSAAASSTFQVNGVTIGNFILAAQFTVQPGASYSCPTLNGGKVAWWELR